MFKVFVLHDFLQVPFQSGLQLCPFVTDASRVIELTLKTVLCCAIILAGEQDAS